MNVVKVLGYSGLLCMLPLAIKQAKVKSKAVQFAKKYHYAIGWLMLLLIIPHILFSFSTFIDYPFGLLALACLSFLDGFIFISKKTKKLIAVHKYIAILLLVFISLHVFFE